MFYKSTQSFNGERNTFTSELKRFEIFILINANIFPRECNISCKSSIFLLENSKSTKFIFQLCSNYSDCFIFMLYFYFLMVMLILVEALPACGTEDCMLVTTNLIINKEVDQQHALPLLNTIGFTSHLTSVYVFKLFNELISVNYTTKVEVS